MRKIVNNFEKFWTILKNCREPPWKMYERWKKMQKRREKFAENVRKEQDLAKQKMDKKIITHVLNRKPLRFSRESVE